MPEPLAVPLAWTSDDPHLSGTSAPIGTKLDADDDGWLATFLCDPATGTSDLARLDGARVDAEPVAVLRLPQRVPQGLHGAWFAG